MKSPAQADLQRWSEEVARDPASLAFLPLARAYRRQGMRPAARQLCLRGLEHYPTHAEAHSLLALLYLEDGERTKAADEWSMVLRMDPNHFEALRGIGFCYLEQDQLSRARQALERAALLRPADAAVQEALKVLGTRQELHSGNTQTNAAPDDMDAGQVDTGESPPAAAAPDAPAENAAPAASADGFDEPWAQTSPSQTSSSMTEPEIAPAPQHHASHAPQALSALVANPLAQQILGNAAAPAPSNAAPPAAAAPKSAAPASSAPPSSAPASMSALPSDPTMLFDAMTSSGPLFGVLLLDSQGLIMAGSLGDSAANNAEALAASLGPAINEASRTVSLLTLGAWRGMLLETAGAVLHVSPVNADAVVLIAAKRNAPTGWVLRTAGQAAELAARYLQEYA